MSDHLQRGSSGASITLIGDDVTKRKLGDLRIADQGRWLQVNSSPAVPYVYRVYEESYVMERLFAPPVWLLDHHRVVRELIAQLNRYVWSRPPVVPINHEMLRVKIEKLLSDFGVDGLWPWVQRTYGRINWGATRRCLTHGDPTFDNVMIRESTGDIVIVDPIPAALVNPDMWCVDLGKLLQSALGWESVRYGVTAFSLYVGPHDLHALLRDVYRIDDNEWSATVLWSVIHLLRTLPYIDESLHPGVRRLIGDATALL